MAKNIDILGLKEELLEKITTYLDVRDLKFLSQTCKYINEISWKSLGKITEIHFWKILSNADIETFSKSKRNYENGNFLLSNYNPIDDVIKMREILQQVASLASINLENLTLILASNEVTDDLIQVLKTYEKGLKQITITIDVRDSSLRTKAEQLRTLFPKIKVIFQPYFAPTSDINYSEVNEWLQDPREILFRNNFNKIQFDKDVLSARNIISYCDVGAGLNCFKNIENLEINGEVDLKILETFIESNVKSLKRLKINKLEGPWLYKLPCQMKELTCWYSEDEDSSTYADILSNQKFLRYQFLNYTLITNKLLDVLAENKYLTTVEFFYNTLEGSLDVNKFQILKNISEITYTDTSIDDLTLLNAIFENSKKLCRLVIEVDIMNDDPEEMTDIEVSRIDHLRILQISGIDISKYISKKIRVPNLEVCDIDCYPEFLFECKHLRTLNIIAAELDYEQVVTMLASLPSLETFTILLTVKDVERTFQYILGNMNTVKHFKIDIFGDKTSLDIPDIVESSLKARNISWEKVMYLYKTENFSFEI